MFNINDAVVYASYGVCMITSVETRDFSGEDVEYYVLQPVDDDKNKFYVPVENSELQKKMRRVCTRQEVEEIISVMPDEDFIWIEDDSERKEVYRNIISEGDRHKLVMLIKTLYIHRRELSGQKRKLHSHDEKYLNEAENMLYDEFAYVLEIPRSDVVDYIKKAIRDKNK
ncbi:MAG: transcriptional regulator [Ruminococcus flavefaciens]|jgi:CarD family transcriptional regulator|nr:transcriptional regulator [Ruminococcus flavefaciens]